MYTYNPLEQHVENNNYEASDGRIGKRIREIRKEQGLTQSELGENVGLVANRIQQYENGARNPRTELCKKMAEVLEVDARAIMDPKVSDFVGAMYAFFEMETLYDLRVKEIDGQMCLCFGEKQDDARVSTMNKNLKIWHDRRKQLEKDLINTDSHEERKKIIHDYQMWEWNFPHSIDKDEK
ncbi:helix-turn-helix domain-containing protein [Oribacterium sp. NK2B42]|uniref:helix-turn-helix domain-containing protein n=1 Tax=Oribacterium sp. NK2B42 TaxID=689781 RepID=UPI0005D2BE14|nr:helix-turn-helix transcriptional regulator [Oribacterium sp. NK2B42]